MSWWCGVSCGVLCTVIAVTLVSWVIDEAREMQNFDDTQVKLRSEEQ